MTTMTVQEAKHAFGKMMDAAQRAPVIITRDGQNFGAVFAMADLLAMAQAFLSPPLRDSLRAGRITISEALLREAELAMQAERLRVEKAEARKREQARSVIPLHSASRRSVI
ncbi:hypothetical protein GEU84_019725 [Fertoebacter nigrum]|uniref:Antitoxin n=1 Tax=Fertoeibacter niger TaxID=2656921 RepID=A0A8X8KMP9_9RHOB|nr:hypothetical protein [Fertoeibacter niger]NUB46624.1 hypothetical protein [Fertoeibacter niger]